MLWEVHCFHSPIGQLGCFEFQIYSLFTRFKILRTNASSLIRLPEGRTVWPGSLNDRANGLRIYGRLAYFRSLYVYGPWVEWSDTINLIEMADTSVNFLTESALDTTTWFLLQ